MDKEEFDRRLETLKKVSEEVEKLPTGKVKGTNSSTQLGTTFHFNTTLSWIGPEPVVGEVEVLFFTRECLRVKIFHTSIEKDLTEENIENLEGIYKCVEEGARKNIKKIREGGG